MIMDNYFTADTHFGHANILRFCNRPYKSVEEMDEALIDNWNNTISGRAKVYILGDFAFVDHKKYLDRLRGKKILIIGSHDSMSDEVLKCFTEVHETTYMFKLNHAWYFMAHNCHRVWERCHYGVPHLFGHSHGRLDTYNMSIDVGVDTKIANYCPLDIDQVNAEISKKVQMMEAAGRIISENGKTLYRQDDVSYWRNKATNTTEFPL